jgi:hypothetical protein
MQVADPETAEKMKRVSETPVAEFGIWTPEQFSASVQQALDKLKAAEETPTNQESLEDIQALAEIFALLTGTFMAIQNEILKVRALTERELTLEHELDAVLGRILNRAARLKHGLQRFKESHLWLAAGNGVRLQ